MDITSGGTGGPRLSEQWWDRQYNVAGCLKRWEPEALARVLAENGWSARKSSWFEFEVTREWVELCLIPAVAGQVTFSGVIDPSRLADLEATLGPLGAYEIEFTADDGHRAAPHRWACDRSRARAPPLVAPGTPGLLSEGRADDQISALPARTSSASTIR